MIIGIDPGKFGAFCVMDGDSIEFIDMPITTEPFKKTRKEVIDLARVSDILTEYVLDDPLVCLEHIWDFGAAAYGASSGSFVFARDYGGIIGILRSLKLRFILAAPQAWQRAHKKPKGTGKRWSIETAKRLFPQAQLIKPRCRVPSDGRADALLIASYARMKEVMTGYGKPLDLR